MDFKIEILIYRIIIFQKQPVKIQQIILPSHKQLLRMNYFYLMQQSNPKDWYNQEIEKLVNIEKKFLKRKYLLSLQRFAFVILSFAALWKLWPFSIVIAFTGFLIFFSLFIFTVVRDLNNKETLENTRQPLRLCHEEIEILNHHFTHLPDGQNLQPAHHEYASDLDVFGKASLYQYLNRTVSQQGNQRMAHWLLHPAKPEIIALRQEASLELSIHPDWRHQFRVYGINNPVTLSSENKIINWLNNDDQLNTHLRWKTIRFLFPVVTIASLLLYIFNVLSLSWFIPLLIIFFIVASGISKSIMTRYTQLNKIVPELETMEYSICWMEKSSFKSILLNQLKDRICKDSFRASFSIKNLKKILSRLDYRYNPIIYLPLNTFFLWDLQQIFILDKWKTENRQHVPSWFFMLAETEALITIATAAFNHPDWRYPELLNNREMFVAEEIGHPLIQKEKRVTNSFSTEGEKQINLVTGSNMAGKSTFLRSIGINIVLAMMGAPVCGRKLKISPMKVMSSMRVNDNLEENTSTFYAELKKLREIIEAVDQKENVFILLDEILRGTNSADRQAGSIALLKQLIRENASCMVATHDLELAKLADEFPDSVHNYHFDVQIKNEELYFDYKIKKGVCTSMNASLLMKKIGIRL